MREPTFRRPAVGFAFMLLAIQVIAFLASIGLLIATAVVGWHFIRKFW